MTTIEQRITELKKKELANLRLLRDSHLARIKQSRNEVRRLDTRIAANKAEIEGTP
jgi:hypothetical protein